MHPRWLDQPEVQRGRAAEIAVANWLKRRGNWVIPSYDYAGLDHDKPPRLETTTRGLSIPDLDVSKDGARIWIEVKLKAAPTWGRISGKLEHGISARLANHYTETEKITGCAVWIIVVEESSGEWRAALLSKLRTRERSSFSPRMGGMVFWLREDFHRIA